MKSVLLYGCETWLVTNKIQRKIQTFVNRCLRYILRIWWPNIVSNKDLCKLTGQKDINLEIRKRKFWWIGHTLRKENGKISKAALLWNPQGNRKRGRPKNSWRRSIIREAGRTWNELRFFAADRQKWKGLIDSLCSSKERWTLLLLLLFSLLLCWLRLNLYPGVLYLYFSNIGSQACDPICRQAHEARISDVWIAFRLTASAHCCGRMPGLYGGALPQSWV